MPTSKSKGKRVYKPVKTKEVSYIKRRLEEGATYKRIGIELGRSESSVWNIASRNGIRPGSRDNIGGSVYSREQSARVNEKIKRWIEDERLNAVQISRRLKSTDPPGLGHCAVSARIKKLGSAVWMQYKVNCRSYKSRCTQRQHARKRLRSRSRSGLKDD